VTKHREADESDVFHFTDDIFQFPQSIGALDPPKWCRGD